MSNEVGLQSIAEPEAAATDGLLAWPKQGETPYFLTEFTCRHRGLLAEWTYPIIGEGQHCEVCDEPRTIVGVSDLGD